MEQILPNDSFQKTYLSKINFSHGSHPAMQPNSSSFLNPSRSFSFCLQPVSSRLICLPSPPASYQLLFYIFYNNAYIHLLHLLKNPKAFVYSAYQIHAVLARDFSLEPIIYDIWWRFSPPNSESGGTFCPHSGNVAKILFGFIIHTKQKLSISPLR